MSKDQLATAKLLETKRAGLQARFLRGAFIVISNRPIEGHWWLVDHRYSGCQRASANATYVSLDLVPSFPPPAAITIYWRPRTMYVLGVAYPAAGSVVSHSTAPPRLSSARNLSS